MDSAPDLRKWVALMKIFNFKIETAVGRKRLIDLKIKEKYFFINPNWNY
jgi:hypothetical protein